MRVQVQDLGLRVCIIQGLRYMIQGLGFRIWDIGIRGLGFRVWLGTSSSVVDVSGRSSDPVSSTEEVVVPGCSPAGVVCGRAVWGSPANVVEVTRCSSVVASGEDVTPA